MLCHCLHTWLFHPDHVFVPMERMGQSAGNWRCQFNPCVRTKGLNLLMKKWTAAVTSMHRFHPLHQPQLHGHKVMDTSLLGAGSGWKAFPI